MPASAVLQEIKINHVIPALAWVGLLLPGWKFPLMTCTHEPARIILQVEKTPTQLQDVLFAGLGLLRMDR